MGQQPNPVKHFTLKRKPKSVALRSELLAKAAEVQANQKKAQAPTVPVRSRGMPRKMTDTSEYLPWWFQGIISLRNKKGSDTPAQFTSPE